MVDKELLSRKVSQLRGYLNALRKAEDISWEKPHKMLDHFIKIWSKRSPSKSAHPGECGCVPRQPPDTPNWTH